LEFGFYQKAGKAGKLAEVTRLISPKYSMPYLSTIHPTIKRGGIKFSNPMK